MPKGETIKHEDWSVDFRMRMGSLDFILNNGGEKIIVDAKGIKSLKGAIKHAENHLKKYYDQKPTGEWVEQRPKVGSIIKNIQKGKLNKEHGLVEGRLYTVIAFYNSNPIVANNVSDPIEFETSDYELVQQ